jgi:glycosyltransferase involved in cell wall biosynthesis
LDLLFAAFQRLVDTTPPADQERLHLVIVGGGTGCEHLVSTYRALIKQLGIEPFVTFTGQRPASEMGAFMNLADVLVSPRTEGNNPPLKIYSYMAMAKPIVATAISSHTQVLDESCAFMTMPTPTAFAEALRRASDPSAGSDEERALRIQEASARVNGRFGKAEFHKRLKELYSFTPVAQRSPEIAGWLITALQLLEA